jgi:HD-like signal output (HDOD) protein
MISAGKKVTISAGKQSAGGGILAQLKSEKAKSAGQAAEIVEELVLGHPGLKGDPPPRLFNKFIEELLPKVRLPDTSLAILSSFANIDVTAERIGQCLKANPYYQDIFFQVIETMGKRQERPALEAAVILLGMENSRNLILALQAHRNVTGKHPGWTKDGKLELAPKELLKFALRIRDSLAGKKDSYEDTGFAAGMLFDLMVLIAEQDAQDPKRVRDYIDTIFAHGLKAAQIGDAIAKRMPDFTFHKFAFSACLVHDIGKIALAILEPKYFDFLDECAKKSTPRVIRMFAENRRFGVTHAALGAMICTEFGIFGPIEKAILFHHDPYILKVKRKALYDLASVICYSTNIANNWKKIEKDDDPVLSLWRGPELTGFRADPRTVREAVSKLPI